MVSDSLGNAKYCERFDVKLEERDVLHLLLHCEHSIIT